MLLRLFLLALLAACCSSQKVWWVAANGGDSDSCNSNDPCSLRKASNSVGNNDVVQMLDGVYSETIQWNDRITIRAVGPNVIQRSKGWTFSDRVNISGVRFENTLTYAAVSISASGSVVVIENCSFKGGLSINDPNLSTQGSGAIWMRPSTFSSSSLTIRNTTFFNNTVMKNIVNGYSFGAVQLFDVKTVLIEGSTFEKNTAASLGGAISLLVRDSGNGVGQMQITRSSFKQNQAGQTPYSGKAGGGAIYIERETNLAIQDSSFVSNSAVQSALGGSILIAKGSVNITGTSSFNGSIANSGKDLLCTAPLTQVKHCVAFLDVSNCTVVSTCVTTSPVTTMGFTTSTSPAESDSKSDSGNRAGLIAGILIPLLLVVATAAVAVYLVMRRRKKSKAPRKVDEEDNGLRDSIMIHLGVEDKVADWEIDYRELELSDPLGEGSFGVVYKARWRNADVVVKQLKSGDASDFVKEAHNVMRLKPHAHIIQYFGVCINPDYPVAIVMEYMPLGSLLSTIRKYQLTELSACIQFAMDICSGMQHLHAQNILHLDLAARNLLMFYTGTRLAIKVGDFGLSRITESGTYNAKSQNTFAIKWSAPEVFEGELTKKADVWSFGVVLWEMLEQKIPYVELSNVEAIGLISNKNYRLPKPTKIECPDELDLVMRSCWQRDPQQRPDFGELYKTLSNIGQSVGASNPQQTFTMEVPEKEPAQSLYNNS